MSVTKKSIFTEDESTGNVEVNLYLIIIPEAAGMSEFDTLYSTIMPEGVTTKQLYITHAYVNQRFFTNSNCNFYDLLIESPAESEDWKMPLAFCKDGFKQDSVPFTYPMIFSPGDVLCPRCWCANALLIPDQFVAGLHGYYIP